LDPSSLFLEYLRGALAFILSNLLELLRDLWPVIGPVLSLVIVVFAVAAMVLFPFLENTSKELLEIVVILVIIYILLSANANSLPIFRDHWLTIDFENAHLM
jgi:peptidoglycan/LPS O-acetylase OafA/YrhL